MDFRENGNFMRNTEGAQYDQGQKELERVLMTISSRTG